MRYLTAVPAVALVLMLIGTTACEAPPPTGLSPAVDASFDGPDKKKKDRKHRKLPPRGAQDMRVCVEPGEGAVFVAPANDCPEGYVEPGEQGQGGS